MANELEILKMAMMGVLAQHSPEQIDVAKKTEAKVLGFIDSLISKSTKCDEVGIIAGITLAALELPDSMTHLSSKLAKKEDEAKSEE